MTTTEMLANYVPKTWWIAKYGKPGVKPWMKCDAEGCDWMVEIDGPEEWPSWRNQPCPKCGANVFTDEDYQAIIVLNAILGFPPIRFINWLGLKFRKPVMMKVGCDGKGGIVMDVIEKKEDTN